MAVSSGTCPYTQKCRVLKCSDTLLRWRSGGHQGIKLEIICLITPTAVPYVQNLDFRRQQSFFPRESNLTDVTCLERQAGGLYNGCSPTSHKNDCRSRGQDIFFTSFKSLQYPLLFIHIPYSSAKRVSTNSSSRWSIGRTWMSCKIELVHHWLVMSRWNGAQAGQPSTTLCGGQTGGMPTIPMITFK